MDWFIEKAFDSIKEIGINLKKSKIGNIEAANQICSILCQVKAYDFGGKAAQARIALEKEFEV